MIGESNTPSFSYIRKRINALDVNMNQNKIVTVSKYCVPSDGSEHIISPLHIGSTMNISMGISNTACTAGGTPRTTRTPNTKLDISSPSSGIMRSMSGACVYSQNFDGLAGLNPDGICMDFPASISSYWWGPR